MKKLFALTFFWFFLLPFSSLQAQGVAIDQNFSIKTSPAIPEPNSEVTVELDAYAYDTVGATINWFIDGQENTNVKNQYNFKLNTKAIGQATEIKVVATMPSGKTLTKTILLKPARVDVVIEANTLVPSFYQGRALPTIGSTIRVIATPYTGESTAAKDFTYAWKHDNQVLFGGPVKGKQVAEIEVGQGLEQIITVDVINKNGVTVARKSVVLPLHKPEVVFYEENPLRGASQIAINNSYYLTSDEVTLRAEPYYMDKNIFSSQPLIEWTLNNRKISNQSQDPQYLTLQKKTDAGAVKLRFHIRNLNQLLQGVKGDLSISF